MSTETRCNYKHEAEALRKVIEDIAWMARRYADGRSTYAPSMYNEAAISAMRLGCKIRPDFAEGDIVFARDGMEDKEAGHFCLPEKFVEFEKEYCAKWRADHA